MPDKSRAEHPEVITGCFCMFTICVCVVYIDSAEELIMNGWTWDTEELIMRPTPAIMKAEIKELRALVAAVPRYHKWLVTLNDSLRRVVKMAGQDRRGQAGIRSYISEVASLRELLAILP